jgi:hypothetical protein
MEDKDHSAELAAVGNDTGYSASVLTSVSMPPPAPQDWQVSPADGPDWELKHFVGGVEKIERKNGLLIFHFVAGGQVSVQHGVTYLAPERH